MNTKFTIEIDESIAEKARLYAVGTQRNLSELIESLLLDLVDNKLDKNYSSRIKRLAGAVKIPDNFDEKKELHNYFRNKHL